FSSFFSPRAPPLRALHSFPTRRSSDLRGVFELPPLLLALAFILVGLAAWFLGRRNGAARTVRLPRDYYVGLDHLINDRFDHAARSEEHTSELQSRENLVCRLLLEKKKK